MSINPMSSKSSANSVALLIDGDNIAASQIDQILAEAGMLGEVTVRRLYGKWQALRNWKRAISQHALEPKEIGSGKNGSDIALVIGAMDLFYRSKIKHFCIAACDIDYKPLVEELRRRGCEVLGIGKPETPEPLRKTCSEFVQLSMPPKSVSADELQLINLLKEAYLNELKRRRGNEWVSIQQLGSELSILTPHYKTLSGTKKLSMLIKEHQDLFDIGEEGQDKHIIVRLRKLEAEEDSIAA